MKLQLLSLLTCTMLCLCPMAFSADIEGGYRALGSNPGGGSYTGSVEISRTGQTYSGTWNTGTGNLAQVYLGTGILTGNVLSVAYIDENRQWIGVVAYEVKSDGRILEGRWTGFKGTQLGGEKLTRR